MHDGDPARAELLGDVVGEELPLGVVTAAGAEEVLQAALAQSHRSGAVGDVHDVVLLVDVGGGLGDRRAVGGNGSGQSFLSGQLRGGKGARLRLPGVILRNDLNHPAAQDAALLVDQLSGNLRGLLGHLALVCPCPGDGPLQTDQDRRLVVCGGPGHGTDDDKRACKRKDAFHGGFLLMHGMKKYTEVIVSRWRRCQGK